ncbi:hypothetical protein Taro_005299 [Colocasia esculenta]|uniref:Uncharacterized protein n=1 Tax=Colocasia esculenta TaxID=4460 RepID=A0A843TPJ5_COLES|nr:hypothetical protein [Colocasia esculenta]
MTCGVSARTEHKGPDAHARTKASQTGTQIENWYSKLANPEAIHGALWSFLDLRGFSVMLLPFLGLLGHPHHFLAFLDIPAISWLSRTFLPVPGFLGHPCRFLAFWDIPVSSWFPGTFLPVPGFLGHPCHFLASWDIPAVFWLSQTSLPFSGFLGHSCQFLTF